MKETQEGNVRVSQQPVIRIGDVALEDCKPYAIRREILALVKKIGEQRDEIMRLRRELDEQATDK